MENRKNRYLKVFLSVIFTIGSFLIFSGLTAATFSVSNVYSPASAASSKTFDSSMCSKTQSFLVQISPTGCTPAVVRSDLLSSQDVPVYCQLDATQLNPLVNVNSISSISLQGNYSNEVSNIGYYPAQAALNTNGQTLSYPVLNNIGYVVIDLKQHPNESSMPDYITGNLTANLKYSAANALGVGTVSYYLPQLSDLEWKTQYPLYSFWGGKGYLKVDSIRGNQAKISIYDRNLNYVSGVVLQSGQTSGTISVPGFDLCSAAANIRLDGLENPNTFAKLNVNGNIVEASNGDHFLENHCQVSNINKKGLVQSAQISCNTDSGKETFSLKTSPRVVVEIDGQKREVGVGQFLFNVTNSPDATVSQKAIQEADNKKSVYLGYIGSKSSSGSGPTSLNDVYLDLSIMPRASGVSDSDNMTLSQLTSFANLVNLINPAQLEGNPVLSALSSSGKIALGIAQTVIQFISKGNDLAYVKYNAVNNDLGRSIKFVGFANGYNSLLDPDTTTYYKEATADYQTVSGVYSSEKYPSSSSTTLGEQALYNQILLAKNLNQKSAAQELCKAFTDRYPSATEDTSFCSDLSLLSSTDSSSHYVTINGQSYLISFDGIYEPPFSDFGAIVQVTYPDGHSEDVSLSKDQTIILNSENNDFIKLNSLSEGTAVVNIKAGLFSSGSLTLKQDVSQTLSSKDSSNSYILTLKKVNLNQLAKVEIIPKTDISGSQSNFAFNISIEKRSVQLSPDFAKKKIENLNSSITNLEKISNVTGKVLSGLSTACTATGYLLTVTNFLKNLGGEGAARTLVMTSAGGWNEKCTDMVNNGEYSSTDQCFLKNSQDINNDVSQVSQLMSQQNQEVKAIQDKYTTKGSLLSNNVVDTDRFMQDYVLNVAFALDGAGENSIVNPSNSGQSITLAQAKDLMNYSSFKENNFNVAQAKNVELYSQILGDISSSDTLSNLAQQGLYSTLSEVKSNSDNYIQQRAIADATDMKDNIYIGAFGAKVKIIPVTSPITFSRSYFYAANKGLIPDSNYVYLIKNSAAGQETYLVDYTSDGIVNRTYTISGTKLTLYQPKDANGNVDNNYLKVQFKFYSAGTYHNEYKNPKVQYFETDPYKGSPAVVPFDLKNGWYAAVRQTTASIGSSVSSYDTSGRVNSFYLCNVGANGLEEFGSSSGDDICESMNIGTGQVYDQFPGLDSNEAVTLVNRAVSAIQQAATARANNPSGLSSVVIKAGGISNTIKVGQPAANIPAIQCQDFMSPNDCSLLFNVCDPVVCPPSRCNFGGTYPVSDVIQTGVVGGLFLCLPNAKEGIAMPVCLTGIQSGLDNWISVEKSWRDCLQNNLKTGQYTGICDETASIYGCQLFWQEAAPLANVALPKIAEAALGQNVQGGGEYANFQNALDTAKQSASYLNNVYSSSSLKSFNLGTATSGAAICKNFISTVFPSSANIADQISAVDSPPQYTGSFSSSTYTTATVPATDMYKVYYHIYAGKNSGVYYSVYLKNSGSSYYQDSSSTRLVDSGYIAAGSYSDNTSTFTAPSGYTQMCINVNGQENCGFQQVSTSLATNVVQATYVANQVNNSDIKTSGECISGTIDLSSLLNSNAQSGVTSTLHPSIAKLGITRVCATSNPSSGTDPYSNSSSARWVKVGYCDNKNLGCWLDTRSVENAINSPDIAAYLSSGETTTLQNSTIQGLENAYSSALFNAGNYMSKSEFNSAAKNIATETDPNKKISGIQNVISKVFYNNQKAYLLLLRGGAYAELAILAKQKADAAAAAETTSPVSSSCALSGESCGISNNNIACCAGEGQCTLSSPAVSQAATGSASPSYTCQATIGLNGLCYGNNDCTTGYCNKVKVTSGYCDNVPSSLGGTGSTSGTQATTTSQTSTITSDEILKAMNYANPSSITYGGKIGNRNCDCGDSATCKKYADVIVSAAKDNNENPLLVLSVMMQESECNVTAENGKSEGLMQIYSWDICSPVESLGINSAADVKGVSNYDKNIKCGAFILRNKYDLYHNGQKYPNSGGICNGFSATYYGWNASLRGYLGYVCVGDPKIDVPGYVDNVNLIYGTLAKDLGLSQISIDAGSAVVTGGSSNQQGTTVASEPSSKSLGGSTTTSNVPISINPSTFVSPIFKYDDADTSTPDIYFEYSQGKWYWSEDKTSWYAASDIAHLGKSSLSYGTLLQNINGEIYVNGLGTIIYAVINSNKGWLLNKPSISTQYVAMNNKGMFTFTDGSGTKYQLNYTDGEGWATFPEGYKLYVNSLDQPISSVYQPHDLIVNLVNRDLYNGAAIIFDSTPEKSNPIFLTSTGLGTNDISFDEINKYNSFKSTFEEYSASRYLPSGWSSNSFKALIVAIAEQESGLNSSNSDWIMGYPNGVHDNSYYGPDTSFRGLSKQVSAVSDLLKNVLNRNFPENYAACNSKTSTDQLSCILSVYHTSKVNSNGIFNRNSEGDAYANEVLALYKKWSTYFASQSSSISNSGTSVSSTLTSSSSSSQGTTLGQTSSGDFVFDTGTNSGGGVAA